MSRYTTGELAKLCDISVRTVQYYDTRGILSPSELSEGGRRLYTDADLDRLKIICFLRDLDLPIDSIKSLFAEEHPEQVISVLLDEQERCLHEEIAEKKKKAAVIAETKRSLSRLPQVSVDALGDVAHMMKNKKDLRRLRIYMLALGFLMDAIEISTLMLWIFYGFYIPFLIGMGVCLAIGIYISVLYFRRTVYICPACHTVFRPRLRDSLFARHTPNTRKLTCTHCGHRGFCVETYQRREPC